MIEKRIETFIRANEEDEETFQTLMIELFRKQFEENAPYRAFCQEKRKTPRTVKRWQDIPFVPVDAFKHLTLSRVPVEEWLWVRFCYLSCQRPTLKTNTAITSLY